MVFLQVTVDGNGLNTLMKAWVGETSLENCQRQACGEGHYVLRVWRALYTVEPEGGKWSFEQSNENAVTDMKETF